VAHWDEALHVIHLSPTDERPDRGRQLGHRHVLALPWAEYTYNTAYQSSLCDTPFCVVYDRDPQPSAPMSLARPASQRSPRRWRSTLPSSMTSAITLNKHRRSKSASTTSTTGQCPSGLVIGLFFAFGSGQQHPSHARQQGSSSHDTLGRTRWWSSSMS
jgi:hypothetical protein